MIRPSWVWDRLRGQSRQRLAAVAVVAVLVLAGCAALASSPGPTADNRIHFENVTQEVGLDYEGEGVRTGNGNSGVYVADVNGDGWQDVLAVGGERPALYLNREATNGSRAFERSGRLGELGRSFKSAVFVDVERDGWPELFLFPRGGEPVAYDNREGRLVRADYGLGNLTYPLGATAADYDGDGDTDLFVVQSGNWAEESPRGKNSLYKHVENDNGNPNVLYENTGQTGADRFRRVTDAGISGERWSYAASFVDLTGDGRPDIHVANDYNNDTVYVNRGDGTFAQRLLGESTARNGMASEVADVNGDGAPDVFTTNIYLPIEENMSSERYNRVKRFLTFVIRSGRTKGNTLMINRGNGTFVDRATHYNVQHGGWGWAASLSDFDNDGDRDLLHTTQIVVRIDRDDPKWTYPMVWERDGETFDRLNKSQHGMGEFDGRGMATLDYDHDGDLDVVMASYDGNYAFYENTVSSEGESARAVAFSVVDEAGATALGAEVVVQTDDGNTTVRQTANTDFLSQETRVEHLGVGTAESVTLTVTWPDGTTRTFEDVTTDRKLRISKDGITATAALNGTS